MKTVVLVVLTFLYVGLLVARLWHPVPFEVLVWGGLILILAWWLHDAIHEWKGKRDADRTSAVIG